MPRLERLDERYHSHNLSRQEFVFGADERADLIATLVGGPGLSVLDLGCRTGALTQHYAEGNNVVGVDVDRVALETAEERLGIDTVWADAESDLPFRDSSFDVVVRRRAPRASRGSGASGLNVRRVPAGWPLRRFRAERLQTEESFALRRGPPSGD